MTLGLADSLVDLKKKFQKEYGGKSHTPEVIPLHKSEKFPVMQSHLDGLHEFTKRNPIYYNSYECMVSDTECVVYEGDIDKYWFGSIGHASSRAPFSPTWMMSGYIISMLVKNLGFESIVDVGSGDGRIAYCAKLLDMKAYSIEIDHTLAELQKDLSGKSCEIYCTDAAVFDYSTLRLDLPAMIIGGLAQMGGRRLAGDIMDRIRTANSGKIGWVFAGTHLPKYRPDPKGEAGWGTLIAENGLEILQRLTLPTAWTFCECDETPYVFAANRNPN